MKTQQRMTHWCYKAAALKPNHERAQPALTSQPGFMAVGLLRSDKLLFATNFPSFFYARNRIAIANFSFVS